MNTTKQRTSKRAKSIPARSLGLSESVLKLFPKTSRMGRQEPSRWGSQDLRKVKAVNPKRPDAVLQDYIEY